MNKKVIGELGRLGITMTKSVLYCGIIAVSNEWLRGKNKDQSTKFISSATQAKNLTKNSLTKGYDIDDEFDLL